MRQKVEELEEQLETLEMEKQDVEERFAVVSKQLQNEIDDYKRNY